MECHSLPSSSGLVLCHHFPCRILLAACVSLGTITCFSVWFTRKMRHPIVITQQTALMCFSQLFPAPPPMSKPPNPRPTPPRRAPPRLDPPAWVPESCPAPRSPHLTHPWHMRTVASRGRGDASGPKRRCLWRPSLMICWDMKPRLKQKVEGLEGPNSI